MLGHRNIPPQSELGNPTGNRDLVVWHASKRELRLVFVLFKCPIGSTNSMQCDELRPKCTKCKTSSQECVYPTNDVPKWKSSVSTFSLPSAAESSSPSTASATSIKTDYEYSATPSPPYSSFGEQTQTPLEYDNSFFGNFDMLGHELPPMPVEQSQLFETQDVLLLMHFTSTTSLDLIGPQQL